MAIRYLNWVIGLSFVALLAMTTQAEAATVGSIIDKVRTSISNFPAMLGVVVCYLLGLLFAIQGIFKFKEHVDEAGGRAGAAPLSAAVKKFLAGGMLLSAPSMAGAVQGTLLGGGAAVISNSNPGAVPAGNGVDTMIVNFIGDIAAPTAHLLIVFAYISAVLLLITGIVRLTKSEQEGPRGPAGLGTAMTFLASGALFSFGDMAGTFSNSLFSTTTAATNVAIGSNILSNPADVAQVAPVINAVMIFVMLVGFIAFMRGWFVLKAFADGNSQASVAQAVTFLIGGTMAINLGQLVNAVENSLGVLPANSFTFT